ncbi:MAG: hypothetical protein E7604_04070 [Ruminococcaceae bacterium]|nr:hypothetical protein [Oscillospiraceae bacterium]
MNDKRTTAAAEAGPAYYFRIAKRFRIVTFLLLAVMIVFIIVMFSVNRDEITVENLRYFLRYIDTRQAEKSATTDTIVYGDTESIVRFGIYRNGLVVVGNDRVQIFDLTGEEILDINQSNASPQLLTSEEYMLIYNIGGTTFQLYNSLSKKYEESYSYPIGCAALGDTGAFLVTTRSMEYRSVVNVYNRDFEQIYRWYSPDKHIMDACFRDGDEEFMLATLGTREDGVFYAEIILCETDKEEKRAQFRIEDEIIYRVRYTDDGGIILIGGKAVYVYDSELTLLSTVSYGGYTPVMLGSNGDLTYFTLNKNIVGSNYTLTVLDERGDIIYSGDVQGEITRALLHHNAVYLLFDRSILRISLETGTQIAREIDPNCISVENLDETTLMLCYNEKTQIIDIDAFFFGTVPTEE